MTTTTAAALDPTRLIIAALAGLVILLLLIIKFKVQAMISILVGAVAIGLIAGMPFTDIISSVNEGIEVLLRESPCLWVWAPCSVPYWRYQEALRHWQSPW